MGHTDTQACRVSVVAPSTVRDGIVPLRAHLGTSFPEIACRKFSSAYRAWYSKSTPSSEPMIGRTAP